MCAYNTRARSSADSFAVGSGVWSVFVMFSLAYFGTQSRILFPTKRYFEGLTAKYFAYTVLQCSSSILTELVISVMRCGLVLLVACAELMDQACAF
jgi:hypothetical protein